MIIDAQLLFSDSQDLTGGASNSTNLIDTGVAGGRGLGVGEPLYIWVNVEVALTGASVTCVVNLQGDSTTTITPDATEQLFIIPALAAAGKVYIARLQPTSDVLALRYLRLAYVPTGGAASLSTGTVSAGITTNIQKAVAYNDNITIT